MIQANTSKFVLILIAAVSVLVLCLGEAESAGPLKVLSENPRYFTDGSGKAIYLTGSHTWTSFQDIGFSDPPPRFDYSAYLSFLQKNNHNFFRLWVWEQAKWVNVSSREVWVDPIPFKRTGPGRALDGKDKFDLTRFDETYFIRLRQRVEEAGRRGIYVAVMLFNGWSIDKKGLPLRNPWEGHPFNKHNNINDIDGDPDADEEGKELHSLKVAETLKIQEHYVQKVIDSLNDLPNVLWEISNESSGESAEWQYHMIRFIQRYEAGKPYQHPVGMTVASPGGDNKVLYNSPADWISPNNTKSEPYMTEPPLADGRKVIILDTDHLWGIGGTTDWIWKSFTRGMNPIFMDPYTPYNDWIREVEKNPLFFSNRPILGEIRKQLGFSLNYARKIDFAGMVPMPALCSSRYCMANKKGEYLVYIPWGNQVVVDLRHAPKNFSVEWFNPESGKIMVQSMKKQNVPFTMRSPFRGYTVLHIIPVH